MTNVAVGSLRRRPAQRRSLERVGRMLDECACLLDEVGYEALTTKEVARRAGVPIGTFYQFFPDKQGLVRALALRNLEAFVARLTARLGTTGISEWTGAVDLAVDEFVAMKRSTPGFTIMDFGQVLPVPGGTPFQGTERLLDAAQDNTVIVADRLHSLAVDRLGVPDGPGLGRALVVAVEAADAVLKHAFRAHPSGDSDLIAECKHLVRGYLAGYLPDD